MSKLTNYELEALSAVDSGKKVRESGGLVGTIRVTAGGVSVKFDWRYRLDGKVRQISIGTWPKFSMPEIRRKRDAMAVQLQSCIDPATKRLEARLTVKAEQQEGVAQAAARIQAANAEIARQDSRRTMESIARDWFKVKGQRSGKPKSAEIIRRFDADIFPEIGSMALEDITKGDVRQLLAKIENRGSMVMARHVCADLRQFFKYCMGFGWINVSPTENIERKDIGAKAAECDRVLTEAEIKLLVTALPAGNLTATTELAVWIQLATCCRIGELLRARWSDVDLNKGTWTIPPEIAKNGKAFVIQLSPFAVEKFQALNDVTKKIKPGIWVMPARGGKVHVDVKTVTKQVADRQKGDKAPASNRCAKSTALMLPGGNWTPHDLRRTGATMMVRLGTVPDVADKCLNHLEQNRLRRIYLRHDYSAEMRTAWQVLGERLTALVNSPQVAEVIPMLAAQVAA